MRKSLICAAGFAVFLGAAALAMRPETGGRRPESAHQGATLPSGRHDSRAVAWREAQPIDAIIPRDLPGATALVLLALLAWVGLLMESSLRNIEAAAAEELSAVPIAAVLRRRRRQDAAATRSGPPRERRYTSCAPLFPVSGPGRRRSPGIPPLDLELDGFDEPLDVDRGERLVRTSRHEGAFGVVTEAARQNSIRTSNNVTEIKP